MVRGVNSIVHDDSFPATAVMIATVGINDYIDVGETTFIKEHIKYKKKFNDLTKSKIPIETRRKIRKKDRDTYVNSVKVMQ